MLIPSNGEAKTMAAEQESEIQVSRLLPCFVEAGCDGLVSDSVMLCEVVGDEIQSISLRIAADAMRRWFETQSRS